MNGISNKETIYVKRTNLNGDIYYITANQSRDIYYIYKDNNGKATKLGKGPNPSDLENKFIK